MILFILFLMINFKLFDQKDNLSKKDIELLQIIYNANNLNDLLNAGFKFNRN